MISHVQLIREAREENERLRREWARCQEGSGRFEVALRRIAHPRAGGPDPVQIAHDALADDF